jgi:hypothetical protein
MSDQGVLFPIHPYRDGRVPRVAGSETSAIAAESQEPTLASKQGRVLALIRQADRGLTDDDLEVITGWRHQTVSARRRELVLKELVKDTGRRRYTTSGRPATVWEATDETAAPR